MSGWRLLDGQSAFLFDGADREISLDIDINEGFLFDSACGAIAGLFDVADLGIAFDADAFDEDLFDFGFGL